MGIGTISATLENSDALKRMLEKRIADLSPVLEEATEAAGNIILEEMKYRAPKHTGQNLEPDLQIRNRENTETSSSLEVGPKDFPGARQREYGGVITAKNAPFLVWKDYEGNWHRAKSVYQPPTPYIRPAIVAKRGVAAAKLASMVRKGFGL